MDRSKQSGTFTGSVDQLLNHCSQLNVDELLVSCEKRECIDMIMKDVECSLEEAEQIYNQIAVDDVKNTVDNLVDEGLLEITGYNKEGEPLFSLTELGKKVQAELNKDK